MSAHELHASDSRATFEWLVSNTQVTREQYTSDSRVMNMRVYASGLRVESDHQV